MCASSTTYTGHNVRLRHGPPRSQQHEGGGYSQPSLRPASQELKTFFKETKTKKSLQIYLTQVPQVTDVRQLIESRGDIVDRVRARAQKFSENELLRVLDEAQRWSSRRSGSTDSGFVGDPLQQRNEEKRQWRRALKAVRAGYFLARFLKKRGVRSRADLLSRAEDLVYSYRQKGRRFSLRELEDLLEEFRQPPLPPCDEEPVAADWDVPVGAPGGGRRSGCWHSADDLLAGNSDGPSSGVSQELRGSTRSYYGDQQYQSGLLNVIGDGNQVEFNSIVGPRRSSVVFG